MSKTKKGIAIFCGMVLAISLLFPCTVMKAKAEESVTAKVTIHFVEDVNGSPISSTEKDITVTKTVNENDNTSTYSGTIDLSDVTYKNESSADDTRLIFGWYTSDWTPITSTSSYSFENASLTDSDSDEVLDITLYALCSKTIELTFISNHSGYVEKADTVVLKYYPQSTSNETSRSISLPSESELSFSIDGHVFKGWSTESGKVPTTIVSSIEGNYNGSYRNKTLYAHWQDQRPQGTITEAGQYYLEEGKAYTLGDGTWTVNGDTTTYSAGTVYVKTAGTYTLTKQ